MSGPARALETAAAWLLGLLWALPLAYAVWTAFHPAAYATRFEIGAPLTLDNFRRAWLAAPFARYFLNSVMLTCGNSRRAPTVTRSVVASTFQV